MSDRGERQSLLLPILIPVGGLAVIVVVLFTLSRVLLSLKPNAATAVALVAAAGIMAVATFVAGRKHVSGAALGGFVGAVAGITMFAGGLAIAVIGPPEEEKRAGPRRRSPRRREPSRAGSRPTRSPSRPTLPSSSSSTTRTRAWDTTCRSSTARMTRRRRSSTARRSRDPTDRLPDRPDSPRATTSSTVELHPGTAMEGTITVSEGAGGVTVVAKNTAFDTD